MSAFDHADADLLRGHDWIPAEHVLAGIPRLYGTEDVPLWDKVIHLRYFVGSAEWLIAEMDDDHNIAFGWCDLGQGFPEWGYVSLDELRSVLVRHPSGLPIVAERDLHFRPIPFGQTGRAR